MTYIDYNNEQEALKEAQQEAQQVRRRAQVVLPPGQMWGARECDTAAEGGDDSDDCFNDYIDYKQRAASRKL